MSIKDSKVIVNIFFNAIGQVVNFTHKFLIVPILMGIWGGAKLGEWYVLFSMVSSISLVNLGFSKFYGNKLRINYVNNEMSKYREDFSNAIISSMLVIFLILFISVVSIKLFDFSEVFSLTEWSRDEVSFSIVYLSLNIGFNIFLEMVSLLYVSVGKYSLQPKIQSLNLLIQLVVLYFISSVHTTIVDVSLFILISTICVSITFLIYFIIQNRELCKVGDNVSLRKILTSFGSSSTFQLITLSQFLVIQGAVLVVNSNLGAAFVTLYTVTRTITSGLGRQLIQIINHGIWPELTALYAKNNLRDIKWYNTLMYKTSISITCVFSSFLLCFYNDIFELWLSDEFMPQISIVGCLLLYLLIINLWTPASFILMASNNVKKMSILMLTQSLLFLVISNYYAEEFGLVGVLLILLLTELLILVPTVNKLTNNIIKSGFSEYLGLFLKFLPLILTNVALFFYLSINPINDLFEKVLIFTSLFLIQLTYLNFFIYTKDDKNRLFVFLK
ncbi:lipopolysaccharide biosynthesis protein [Citrobacter portucalensis]|uniref:lipopolysaccharide biosynthesis protein n=1 Tax=Citrobacter portucalensis TaxID=1639133 RepID=UPI0023B01E31|nr:hypothetical protein [Citrobacter portucalensis]